MQASAIEAPHARAKSAKDNSDHMHPSFSSDYAFMNSKNNEDKLTLYMVREKENESYIQYCCPKEGCVRDRCGSWIHARLYC